MKRILSTVIAATFSLALFAQDNTAILNKIKEKAQASISSSFTETRSSVSAPKDCKTLTGKLEFKTPEFLSMEYDNGELFKIDFHQAFFPSIHFNQFVFPDNESFGEALVGRVGTGFHDGPA